MISRAIETCMKQARAKGWARTYWAFDIHGTLVRPSYGKGDITLDFYPGALAVMQQLSSRKDIVKILYTSSYPHEISVYLDLFARVGIRFDYINENPEIADGSYGYYRDKFYFNILLDDKAGFVGETDWLEIQQQLQTNAI